MSERRKNRIEVLEAIRTFLDFKVNYKTEIITTITSGQISYHIVFIEKDKLEPYISSLQIMRDFPVTDNFDGYLFCVCLTAISLYFENQYDETYYRIMMKKMNREFKSEYNKDLSRVVEKILDSDIPSEELLVFLKLEYD